MRSLIRRWLARPGQPPRPRGPRPRPRWQPMLESLEDRCTPATYIWTGAASALWSDPANWAGHVAPGTDYDPPDLVFPAGAKNLTNYNDLSNLTSGDITLGGGYQIAGIALGVIGNI